MRIPSTGVEISGAELEKLLQKMIAHQKLLQVVERRGHPREIVEALVAAGADREYFADKDKLDGVAQALTTPTRTVTVQRDEEHNRYLLHVEDRSSGYPRQHTIGVDFVTAGEYRTLLANRRDIPALAGDIIVSTTARRADERRPRTNPARRPTAPAIGGAPGRRGDEARRGAEGSRAGSPRKDQQPTSRCTRSTSWSSTSSPPARRASPSTATRVSAR